MNGTPQRPISGRDIRERSFSHGSPRRVVLHAGYIFSPVCFPAPVDRRSPCQRTNVAGLSLSRQALSPQSRPILSQVASHRARWPRSRLSTAGDHARLPEDGVCSLFFPRSVGLPPVASRARGALFIAPSMLCQLQAMPSIASYSASPDFHIFRNTPAASQSRKYR